MPAPTVQQGAPFQYMIPCDNNFNFVPPGQLQGKNPAGNPEQWNSNLDNITLLASASYGVGTQLSPTQTNVNARGVIVILNITVIGTGTVTIHIEGVDPVSGQAYDLLIAAAAAGANGTFTYVCYPGASSNGASTLAAPLPLPRSWRIAAIVATGAVTFSVSAATIL